MNNNNSSNFLFGAILGAGAAAVVALLFAPESGKELRKDMKDQAYKAKDSAADYAEKAKNKGFELKDKAQNTNTRVEPIRNREETKERLRKDLANAAK